MDRGSEDIEAGGSDSDGPLEPTPELRDALGRFVPPTARPRFRADLRARFLAGERERTPRVPRVPRVARRRSRRWRLLAGGGLAAAALAALWLRGVLGEPAEVGSSWSVEASGAGAAGLWLDEADASAWSPEELADRLLGARELRTAGQGLRLRYGERFLLEIGAESVLDLTRFPPGAAAPDAELRLASTRGGFRLVTGPELAGGSLIFETPELEARVLGTVFGIDVYPGQGTCVCCTESQVLVSSKDPAQGQRVLPAGGTDFVHQGGVHELIEIVEAHAGPLRALRW